MKSLPRVPALASLVALALLAGSGLSGCLTDEDSFSNEQKDSIDVFPRPQGPKMLPLEKEMETKAVYRYAEFDDSGRAVQRLPDLPLRLGKYSGDTFTYAFEDTTRGYLIRYFDGASGESAGIYILGTFQGSDARWLTAGPILWLPQLPAVGAAWPLGATRTLEAVAVEAPYYTKVLFPGDPEAPVVQGFQRHAAIHIKETSGDTVTHWWLRRGVGILGFQRNAGSRLLASGTLEAIYSIRRYAGW